MPASALCLSQNADSVYADAWIDSGVSVPEPKRRPAHAWIASASHGAAPTVKPVTGRDFFPTRLARLFVFQVVFHVGFIPLLAHPLLPLIFRFALADRLARSKLLTVFGHVLVAPLQHLNDMPAEG